MFKFILYFSSNLAISFISLAIIFNPTVNYDGQKIIAKLVKEIAKLEEKYNIDLNKEEEETMESVVIKVTVPRFVKKEVNDENISDM